MSEERNAGYLIDTIAKATFGEFAGSVELADAIGTTSSGLKQWKREHRPVPPGAWADMLRLLRRRRAEIDQAERELLAELPRIAPDLAGRLESIDDEPSIDEAFIR